MRANRGRRLALQWTVQLPDSGIFEISFSFAAVATERLRTSGSLGSRCTVSTVLATQCFLAKIFVSTVLATQFFGKKFRFKI